MMPLIAPRPMREFTADEFHVYVQEMYALRIKARARPPSPAPGISVTRTKTGKLSVRRQSKMRAFDYITMPELEKLAKIAECTQSDLWNLLTKKKYIIAKDRLAAERTYAEQRGIQL